MSDRAQRVLDALMEYDDCNGNRYPITSIRGFFIDEDYESLTADEEKQVIQEFLELSY